jgi:hypothetical protein
MKKVYVKPVTETFEVEIQGAIATISGVGKNEAAATSEYDNLSDKRSSWGNLW